MNLLQFFLHNISTKKHTNFHTKFNELAITMNSCGKQCRICGGRLNKAKQRKTQSVHSCQDHIVDLQTVAEVCTDPSQLQNTVTPSTFCNPCFFDLRRVKMARKSVSLYSLWLPVEWTPHSDGDCKVIEHR